MTDNEAKDGPVRPAHCPGLNYDGISVDLYRHYCYTLGQAPDTLQLPYLYEALALVVRDRLMTNWQATRVRHRDGGDKQVNYLSMEFLMGRALGNAIHNLEIEEPVARALRDYGAELESLAEEEHDAGLGNGGLGRLAACFLDSCATLRLPVRGYGIRYEYGMFKQAIENGHQVELPDHWLRDGNPWELERAENTRRVRFRGRTEVFHDQTGRRRIRWVDTHDVLAVPYDVPVPGFGNHTVNTLRLWRAAATEEFDLEEFNAGSYTEAVAAKNSAEHITMVLYPNDASENGKELRLRQQYFLASASLQDVLVRWVEQHGHDFTRFAEKNCFQLNDTHPACSVPELMRLLQDEYGLPREQAWDITRRTMAYTNHTLLPEALERWSVSLFSRLLPRLLEIIYEINEYFLEEVNARWPDDSDRLYRMSLIEEGPQQYVRMAHLAIVGSFSVNGVAALHTELLKNGLFRDFHEMWPEKFNNKTNGVTQRRWLAHCNPQLAELITDTIGDGWHCDFEQVSKLKQYADDEAFAERWRAIKLANKQRLAAYVEKTTGVAFDPAALFDVQVKRIHEYKRQLLNVLHVIHLYDRIVRGDSAELLPRSVLIGGRAAPGYQMAKLIIKLVNNVARVVDDDPATSGLLQAAFVPNYGVTAMELICPGTDLSEQISVAGKEASGTGNMKFMLNGALTIGTLDGANIEIRERVGDENFFLFGLDAEGAERTRADYDPAALIEADEDLRRVMDWLESGRFNPGEPGIFNPVIASLRSPHDPWLTAADFRSYLQAQRRAEKAYLDAQRWTRMSILNTASGGWFSSDRTIGQYAREIWDVPVPGAP